MGKWKLAIQGTYFLLILSSAFLSGCVDNSDNVSPSANDRDSEPANGTKATTPIEAQTNSSLGENIESSPDKMLQHLVMVDCFGIYSRIDEPAPLFPFYGPEGWESYLPLDDLMQTEGYSCGSAIINDNVVIKNTTLVFESHDNIAPPPDHPFPGPYNSIRAALSVHADPPEFSAWLKTILPKTKEGAEVKMDRSGGDRQETIILTTPTGSYVNEILLEDRFGENTTTNTGPHRLMLDYVYPYLWMDETEAICGDAAILAEYASVSGDMAATQLQPFPGAPLASRSLIHLCSSFEWTLGGSEL